MATTVISGTTNIHDTYLWLFGPDINIGARSNVSVDAGGLAGLIKINDGFPAGPVYTRFQIRMKATANHSAPRRVNAFRVINAWGEGNKNFSTATTGEATWNSRQHNQNTWNIAGCKGVGTDYLNDGDAPTWNVEGPLGDIILRDLPIQWGYDWRDQTVARNGVVLHMDTSSSWNFSSSEVGQLWFEIDHYDPGALLTGVLL